MSDFAVEHANRQHHAVHLDGPVIDLGFVFVDVMSEEAVPDAMGICAGIDVGDDRAHACLIDHADVGLCKSTGTKRGNSGLSVSGSVIGSNDFFIGHIQSSLTGLGWCGLLTGAG